MRAYIVAAASAAVLLALPAAASAQSPDTASGTSFYGGLGYAQHDYGKADLGTVQGRFGARLNQNFAVEGEVGGGVKSDSIDAAGVHSRSKVTRQGAVYGVGVLPISPKLDLLGRVGYGATQVKSQVNAAGVTDSDKRTVKSLNFGGGGQYNFDRANGLRADYTRQEASNGDRNANVWSLGYVRRF
ncbi:outer membrane beta-barrel protein [Phenylobacterium sp.]|jgi:opacity protein-like surface antigen|uniref:outer membrane beta-barrel protein n=1 Tax=Phenylobacterium sp. TaxID=1871053 RepID=UPI002F429972